MRHKWIVLQILLLSSVCLAAEGQDRCTVSGTVLDRTDSLALHGALVSLTSAYDSTVVFNTVTDGNGAFGAEVDAGGLYSRRLLVRPVLLPYGIQSFE